MTVSVSVGSLTLRVPDSPRTLFIPDAGGEASVILSVGTNRQATITNLTITTLTFNGATGLNVVTVTDNLADAYSIKQGSNSYLKVVTTDGGEMTELGQTVQLDAALNLAGVASPTAFAASADNLVIGVVSVVRVTTDGNGPENLTGMVPTFNGQIVLIFNVGTVDSVVIKHSATSTATNQFICPNSADVTLRKNGSVYAWYDGTSTKWRVMGA